MPPCCMVRPRLHAIPRKEDWYSNYVISSKTAECYVTDLRVSLACTFLGHDFKVCVSMHAYKFFTSFPMTRLPMTTECHISSWGAMYERVWPHLSISLGLQAAFSNLPRLIQWIWSINLSFNVLECYKYDLGKQPRSPAPNHLPLFFLIFFFSIS